MPCGHCLYSPFLQHKNYNRCAQREVLRHRFRRFWKLMMIKKGVSETKGSNSKPVRLHTTSFLSVFITEGALCVSSLLSSSSLPKKVILAICFFNLIVKVWLLSFDFDLFLPLNVTQLRLQFLQQGIHYCSMYSKDHARLKNYFPDDQHLSWCSRGTHTLRVHPYLYARVECQTLFCSNNSITSKLLLYEALSGLKNGTTVLNK